MCLIVGIIINSGKLIQAIELRGVNRVSHYETLLACILLRALMGLG